MIPSDFKALGSQVALPITPSADTLEVFAHGEKIETIHDTFEVEHEQYEFTSVCPRTGQPDYGSVLILFTPRELLIETKSLKLYLNSFRHYRGFMESICTKIHGDLLAKLNPLHLRTSIKFNARGGVITSVAKVFDVLEETFSED